MTTSGSTSSGASTRWQSSSSAMTSPLRGSVPLKRPSWAHSSSPVSVQSRRTWWGSGSHEPQGGHPPYITPMTSATPSAASRGSTSDGAPAASSASMRCTSASWAWRRRMKPTVWSSDQVHASAAGVDALQGRRRGPRSATSKAASSSGVRRGALGVVGLLALGGLGGAVRAPSRPRTAAPCVRCHSRSAASQSGHDGTRAAGSRRPAPRGSGRTRLGCGRGRPRASVASSGQRRRPHRHARQPLSAPPATAAGRRRDPWPSASAQGRGRRRRSPVTVTLSGRPGGRAATRAGRSSGPSHHDGRLVAVARGPRAARPPRRSCPHARTATRVPGSVARSRAGRGCQPTSASGSAQCSSARSTPSAATAGCRPGVAAPGREAGGVRDADRLVRQQPGHLAAGPGPAEEVDRRVRSRGQEQVLEPGELGADRRHQRRRGRAGESGSARPLQCCAGVGQGPGPDLQRRPVLARRRVRRHAVGWQGVGGSQLAEAGDGRAAVQVQQVEVLGEGDVHGADPSEA